MAWIHCGNEKTEGSKANDVNRVMKEERKTWTEIASACSG